MTLDKLMAQIEADEFTIEMMIAPDVDVFRKFAVNKELVQSLVGQLQDKSAQRVIVERIFELLDLDFDSEFLRPKDITIAIYLLVLDTVHNSNTALIALAVEQASNLWWAQQVASAVKSAVHPRLTPNSDTQMFPAPNNLISVQSVQATNTIQSRFALDEVGWIVEEGFARIDNNASGNILPGEEKYYDIHTQGLLA